MRFAAIKPPADPSLPEVANGPLPSRRAFLRALAAGSAAALLPSRGRAALGGKPDLLPGASSSIPDFRLEISEVEWELSPKKKIRTAAYNRKVPGDLLRVREGSSVLVEIENHLDRPEIVHWHGQWIPSAVDGSAEEGTPMIPPGTSTQIRFTARPAGLHWYHTHTAAGRDLKRALYGGQFGILLVEEDNPRGDYDQEQFLALHDWEPYFASSDDGSEMVNYAAASINGRMLGHADPIRVRLGERVLFHILNASATETHWLSLPGHHFRILALDGRPVPTQATVEFLRLGPAERISAVVEMNAPGVWILGEARGSFRDAGMGIVIEYADQRGKPQAQAPRNLEWDYGIFGRPVPAPKPDLTIPLVFTSRFRGHGALDRWLINGRSFPEAAGLTLHQGLRHRLVFRNQSSDDHPVHMHRHAFELVSLPGGPTRGVFKDVVIVPAHATVEVDLLGNNPGSTLFHCHQQDHMDSGFMALFEYA